ncbi:hypothetical protein O3597_19340 [Verrucosispora sp. WMMA2044]|uniref:hypothetical protein n=1 Tax=Verrucosispora sp. WMMA2044 TaxID=3016419 RepID=UPI00248C3C4A|nr:hypothetical protein [Verrucosispora sp. WMMA2044]WBB47293.1 hypothetical protein O3597_19340 [Verrucosispora sp. WMMA2044]
MAETPRLDVRTSGPNSPVIAPGGHIHDGVHNYYVAPDDLPEKKYKVAVRRLDGGMSRAAEQLLAEVLATSYGDRPGVYYHYLVAALSDRTLSALDERHQQALGNARRLVAEGAAPSGESADDSRDRKRLGSLVTLIDLAVRISDPATDASRKEATGADLEETGKAYARLPEEHQRHLDGLLAGPVKDEMFRRIANRVREQRSGDVLDRRSRVWKFFEPDPAEPRELGGILAPPSRGTTLARWAGLGLGLVGVAGVVAQLGSLGAFSTMTYALALAGVGALVGGYARWQRQHHRTLLIIHRERFYGRTALAGEADPEVMRAAVRTVEAGFFASFAPGQQTSWSRMTTGLRHSLAREFAHLYDESDLRNGHLVWLARWHAWQTRDAWGTRRLEAHEETYRERPLLRRAERLGVVLLAVAALLVLAPLLTDGGAESAFPFLAAAGVTLLWRSQPLLWARQSAYRALGREQAERYRAERAEWESWCAVLRDRPTDQEMAAWLAQDVLVFKADMLRERGIRPSEVACALELATGAPGASSARLVYGPIRYSRYVLTLFLLTATGIRYFRSELDFTNGDLHGSSRRSIPYGGLREVEVTEQSVRRPVLTAATPQYGGAGASAPAEPASEVHVRQRRFVVRTDTLGTIDVELGDFGELRDGREPEGLVARLVLDSTGVNDALDVLETVVVDGSSWLTKELNRRRSGLWCRGPESIEAGREHIATPPAGVDADTIPEGKR